MSNTDSPRDPVNELAPTEPGAPQVDDSGPSGPPAPEVIARGYEADVYDSKTVLSVPLLVILFFVLAFVTVTIIFNFIAYPKPDPRAHPAAAKRNNEPLNDRLGRINRGGEVDQPRLEPLVRRAGDARAITQPELAEGNPPLLHPEELRVSKERFPSLYNGDAGKVPLDKTLAMGDEALKGMFRTRPGAGPLLPSENAHTASNAGQGFGAARAVMPQLPQQPEVKKDEKKDPKDNKPPDPKGGK